MGRVRLTNQRIKRAVFVEGGANQIFLWDTDAKGLGVRLTAGSKTFIYQGRLKAEGGTQTIRMSIGDV